MYDSDRQQLEQKIQIYVSKFSIIAKQRPIQENISTRDGQNEKHQIWQKKQQAALTAKKSGTR